MERRIRFLDKMTVMNKNTGGPIKDASVNNLAKPAVDVAREKRELEEEIKNAALMSDVYDDSEYDKSRINSDIFAKIKGSDTFSNEQRQKIYNDLERRKNRVRFEFKPSAKWNYHGLDVVEDDRKFATVNVPGWRRIRVKPLPSRFRVPVLEETDRKAMMPKLAEFALETDKLLELNKRSVPDIYKLDSAIFKLNK